MKTPLLFLVLAFLPGCMEVVQREISVYPQFTSHAANLSSSAQTTHFLKVEGNYFQCAVLKFEFDDSALAYVNHRITEEGVPDMHAVKIINYGFVSKPEILTLPVGRSPRFNFIDVEFTRPSDGSSFHLRAQVETNVPHADHFLGLASRNNSVDREVLGRSMADFATAQFAASVNALLEKLKGPITQSK